jgi:hypothetical protein
MNIPRIFIVAAMLFVTFSVALGADGKTKRSRSVELTTSGGTPQGGVVELICLATSKGAGREEPYQVFVAKETGSGLGKTAEMLEFEILPGQRFPIGYGTSEPVSSGDVSRFRITAIIGPTR